MMLEKRVVIVYFLFLLTALVLNVFSSNYIASHYESIPSTPDLILDSIPVMYDWAMLIAELIVLSCLILIIIYCFKNKSDLKIILLSFASFFALRALLMPLTVLSPLTSYSILNNLVCFSYGLFPSGHTAIPFLAFLITYKKSWQWVYHLVATFLVVVFLFLGKQHYSIDVVATLFICYSLKSFLGRNMGDKKCGV